MSIVDQIKSLFSSHETGASGPLIEHAAAMLSNSQSGGLPALLQKFRDAGMGNVVDSWISKGSNLPISAEHVERALGSDTIRNAAQKLGLSPEMTSNGLASLLPQMIDHLTPNGAVPEQGMLEKALGAMKSKFLN